VHFPALLTEAEIKCAVQRIAEEINRDFGDESVLLVGILKGSLYFLADLSRFLGGNVAIDFMQVSSYGNDRQSSGVVKILKDIDISLENRNVIVVEDIIDTGFTLSHLLKVLATRNPKSLRVASLLSKTEARQVEVEIDYLGFEIPNRFVVGYGLDDAERFRNLPYIAVLPTAESA